MATCYFYVLSSPLFIWNFHWHLYLNLVRLLIKNSLWEGILKLLLGPLAKFWRKKRQIGIKRQQIFSIKFVQKRFHAGNRPHTHFNKIWWDNVVIKFWQRSGRNYDYKQLKNRWEALKTQYKAWKKLPMETGLGWDADKNTVLADDSWWEEKINISLTF